jgi:cation/acetate symporter
MSIALWTWILVGLTFSLYIGIAVWSRAKSTGDFYVAAKQVHPVLNGMATGADWMSAASFISMAGLISFLGRDGSMYLPPGHASGALSAKVREVYRADVRR